MKRDPLVARVQSDTCQILETLIQNSCAMQDRVLANNPPLNAISLAREYGTIRLCSTRQAGHSYVLVEMALKYFERVLFLSPTHQMSVRLYRKLMESKNCPTNISRATASSIETEDGALYLFKTTSERSSLDSVLRGENLDAVMVDGTFDLSAKKEDSIYQMCEPCMANKRRKFFIFVQ